MLLLLLFKIVIRTVNYQNINEAEKKIHQQFFRTLIKGQQKKKLPRRSKTI